MATFKEMLQASFKSNDTEEWLDVHFTRPIGLVFALFWNKLGVHPNVITILSIFLGIGAGICVYYTDLWHNLAGVALLMLANFCDSTDGQMARLTGKKTLIGTHARRFFGRCVVFLHLFCPLSANDAAAHPRFRHALGHLDLAAGCCRWPSLPFAAKLAFGLLPQHSSVLS